MTLLFKIEEEAAPDIQGLTYIPGFISAEEEVALIAAIDDQPWLTDLKRRVQQYGYRYDYTARALPNNAYLGPLPAWIMPIARRLHDQGLFKNLPDQAIVNEYAPGQGISAHIDCRPCFGEVIASLSLGSTATMQFTHPPTARRYAHFLEERSLIVLSGPARYEWTHAIPARKSDMIGDRRIARGRRLSLTFRTMILK